MKRGKKKKDITAIIGIGASAGGLEPLQTLISQLPSDLENAVIIVAQHMSPNYDSKLVDLIKRKTTLDVLEAKNGISLKGNAIFIAPPNHNIEVRNHAVFLSQTNEIGPKPSINLLFESIAKSNGQSRKVGIILSGTGSDGTKGMEVLKKMGGATIAQEPSTAKYDGMPSAAINSGYVQVVMEPESIGKNLGEIIRQIDGSHDGNSAPALPDNGSAVDKIIKALSTRMGVNFSGYKTSTLYRRLDKRMNDSHFLTVDNYLDYVNDHPEELDVLFQNVLIGVTQFFRDKDAFDEISKVLSDILKRDSKGTVRIWVPGCATGEEAYSLAIIVHQLLNSDLSRANTQIFATDIDENALHIARRGVYSQAAVETVPEEILSKYFEKTDVGYELAKVIRKMVLFSRHDLTSNPPFLRINLITCRNLLIYFDNELQNQIIPMFHYSLSEGGYLFLGKSETIGDFNNLFNTVSQKYKIYQKRDGANHFVKLPYLKLITTSNANRRNLKKLDDNVSVSEMVKETFYQSFDHPYVVINENMELVEVAGDVSHVMGIRSGPASSNALKLIDKSLQIELRAVAGQCFRTGEYVRGNIRRLKPKEGEIKLVRIAARPLLFSRTANPLYLIVFENIEIDNNYIRNQENVNDTDNSRIIELEHELAATKEHMNTLIEELETFNEELQATNEELQSSNEELQASNEELETSNEELQSTNEELEIAYNELRTASNEIERQHEVIRQSENNLKTVFNNTLQGFLLVDKKYTIKTFNKTAADIFQNAYGKKIKIGESFIDLIAPEELEDFYRNFQLALKGRLINDKVLIKQKNQEDIWLNYNYSPVVDGVSKNIENVIISFIDNTKSALLQDQRDKLLEELRERNEELKKANQNMDNFVHIIAHDLRSPLGNMKMVAHQFEGAELDEVKELTPILHQCVDRLDNTISGLVKIIEIEGMQNIVEAGINIEDVINDVKYELRASIHESGAQIKLVNISGRRINFIKAFLKSILYNLMSNSIKYRRLGEGLEIKLELVPVKFGYELIFSDNGIGIDLEKYGDRLFTPFKRIAKNGKMGLGVGLHMVKTMVEKNGGQIEVESELGKGTTFRILLKEYQD
jgi:two-component system, chemotaxis family, CheB/CheR fusion protein